MTAQSSSAAGTSDSVAGKPGVCTTLDSGDFVPPPVYPTTPAELREAQRLAVESAREYNRHVGEHLDHATPLRPRELAQLCEMSRVHRHKVTIQWHVDGTAALAENPPAWAVEWLWTYRENH